MDTMRFATPADVPLVLSLIRELADFEGLLDRVVATEEILLRSLFVERKAEVILCEIEGECAGFALFFHNFSTFLGRPGIYLEDLYVRPAFRGRGLGTRFLSRLAALALERDCGRLEWWCLDRNEGAVSFYRKMGAEAMDEWTVFRVDGERLQALADGASGGER